ncbi:LLM class flavin-dependent oxidoreductase [Dolosicoccus paucivorans]|uniref:LLM class flavin-dependent oxidoreductase n=1 Tax=Dolosicoccus paucivorans TaxID=84521 RepID=A0A2N6SPA4_9LACT|nr:LLM class flavin-dependent oxidoreductase [Dolosicoccus paucivorans]PMC58901.1 LLM class flavin-dependent oxidoreductase [Dolosicoccus paucivorans]
MQNLFASLFLLLSISNKKTLEILLKERKGDRVQVSILNLVPRFEGEEVKDAIDQATRIAQLAEELGYDRYWVAEHHNFKGIASSASELVVQHLLSHTNTIRIGAGGVMLPNHLPIQVAERYGTLECLYPGRVDLGLGRAPETDHMVAQVLRHDNDASASGFLKTVEEIRDFLGSSEDGQVVAYPGEDTNVPLYILGSSTSSAYVAAKLGLPYSFATHFAPDLAKEAIEIYRENFTPSKQQKEPYLILGLIVTLAETLEKAQQLHQMNQLAHVNLVRGPRDQLLNANPQTLDHLGSAEKIIVKTAAGMNLVGTKESVQSKWQAFKKEYQPDEIIAVSYLSQMDDIKTSYRLLKELVQS